MHSERVMLFSQFLKPFIGIINAFEDKLIVIKLLHTLYNPWTITITREAVVYFCPLIALGSLFKWF